MNAGNAEGAYISVERTGSIEHVEQAGGAIDEARLLRQLESLFPDLMVKIGELPAEQAAETMGEAVRLKGEVMSPERDKRRVKSALASLTAVAAAAAPVADIIKQISDVATAPVH